MSEIKSMLRAIKATADKRLGQLGLALCCFGACYLIGYLMIRRGAVRFPVTPGSVGYSSTVPREALILRAPILAETQVASKVCTAIFAPLLSIDSLWSHVDVSFQTQAPTLPDSPYPP